MSTIIWGDFMSNSLKERIVQIANAKGISIRRMEKDLGYPEKAIQKIDIHTPSINRVMEIANYLDVSIDVLTGNEVPKYDFADIDDLKYLHDNPELRTLLKAAASLPKDSIKAMAEIAKRMNSNDI